MIEEGSVKVNGRVVTELPVFVDPATDEIRVKGKPIAGEARHVYIMLYKPKSTVTTSDDPAGRRTVVELVNHPSSGRLFPVGRLDYDTLGLILLTNDGELANRLTHPRYGMTKTYRAIVRGSLDDAAVEELEHGIYLAHRKGGKTVGAERTMPVGIELVRRDRERTILDLTLREGRNREVRRIMAKAGFGTTDILQGVGGVLKIGRAHV